MSEKTIQIVKMIDMLPDSDKELAYEIIKKLVLAWDPDFTKVTDKERKDIETAEQSEFFDDSSIDWGNLSAYV